MGVFKKTITESPKLAVAGLLGALAVPGVPNLKYVEAPQAVVDGAGAVRDDLKSGLTLTFDGGVAMGGDTESKKIDPFGPGRLVLHFANSIIGLDGTRDDGVADELKVGADYLWCPIQTSDGDANFLCIGGGLQVFDNLLGHTLADWQMNQAQNGRVIRGGNAHLTLQLIELIFNNQWSMFYRAEFAISNNFVRLPDGMIGGIDKDPRPYGWYLGFGSQVEEGVEFQMSPRFGMKASISINVDSMHVENAPPPGPIFLAEGMSPPRSDTFYTGGIMVNLGFTFNPIPR